MPEKAIIFLTKTFKKTFKNVSKNVQKSEFCSQKLHLKLVGKMEKSNRKKMKNENEKDCISQIKKNQKKNSI